MTNTTQNPASTDYARTIVGLLFLVNVVGLAVGALAFGRYVIEEHERLDVAEIILIWAGDAVALFWFLVYFTRHFLLGVPIVAPARGSRRPGWLWWFAVVSLPAGLLGDVGISLWLIHAEREAFAGAQKTMGTVEKISEKQFPHRVGLALHCRYLDNQQQAHFAVFRVLDPDDLTKMPAAFIDAMRQRRVPTQVAIAFDPDRPARCWRPDLGWNDGMRLHYLSLLPIIFQTILAIVFTAKLVSIMRATAALPWWYDLLTILPITVEAMVLLLFGGLELTDRRLLFWH